MATIIKGKNHRKPFTVRYQHDGRQRERSFATRREADDFTAKFEHDKRERIFIDPRAGSETFGAYVTRWIDQHVGASSTKRNYGSALKQHIMPAIGSVPLSKLTRGQVRTLLLETVPGKGLSVSTAQTCRTLIVGALSEAKRGHVVAENVASGIKLPAISERAEFTMATREQLDKIHASMDARWSLALILMRGCGLRIGEALAVRSDSVRGDVLRIEEQVLSAGKRGPLKHRKPGEFRDVPCPRYVRHAIADHVALYGAGYLFPYFAEGTKRPDAWRREFVREAKAAGLDAHPHSLRHMYASACLAGGVPITDLSRWLGHRDINLTHRVYGHMVTSAVGRAIETLDQDWNSLRVSVTPLAA